MNQSISQGRIDVVDALRGFAIMAIMLLHNIEHFDFYYFPENLPEFVKMTDGIIWKSLFFMFGGKAYAIFALLFGFTFFIQSNNQAKQGKDFRGRFLWRMLLLLGFGIFNSMFYQGDILTYYAILGVTLVIVAKWNNIAVLVTAIILILQPIEWIRFIGIINDPNYQDPGFKSYEYFGKAFPYQSGGSLIELIKGNLTNGRIAVTIWNWEVGRVFQAPALFMIGMLLGRTGKFIASEATLRFWKRGLIIATLAFVPLFYAKELGALFISRTVVLDKFANIISSWSNFAFTWVLVSSFVLLYQTALANKIFKKLQPFGRMTLTNYVMQSIIGISVYYGFGLALFKYTGATYCLLIGIVLFLLQLWFSKWWLKYHSQGPLEALWHRLTWIRRGK